MAAAPKPGTRVQLSKGKRFEYTVEPFSLPHLDKLGDRGWELVAIENGTAILKREKI